MRLEQREWEMDKLREQGHGRDQSTQGPARTGKAFELWSTRGSFGGCQGVSMYVGEWGEERGRCEVKVIGFTFLKDHCGSCV